MSDMGEVWDKANAAGRFFWCIYHCRQINVFLYQEFIFAFEEKKRKKKKAQTCTKKEDDVVSFSPLTFYIDQAYA